MTKRDTDIFESTKNSVKPDVIKDFFPEEDNPFSNPSKKQENLRRLNDYDSNILEDGAYKDINNDAFKLEYKISRTEAEIEDIEAQIDAAKEISDLYKIQSLQNKLYEARKEYRLLLNTYNDMSLSAKITDSVSNIVEKTVGKNFNGIKSTLLKMFKPLISKMPSKIVSLFKVRKSLSLLENINKSVDNLVTMSVPYGENADKYQQLSQYILKARTIQSEISKNLNNHN